MMNKCTSFISNRMKNPFWNSWIFLFFPSIVAACDEISCLCGNSKDIYRFCVNESALLLGDKNPCQAWSTCETCQDGLNRCLTCPKGKHGPRCEQEKNETEKIRVKRQYYSYSPRQDSTGNPCFDIQGPRSGSIRCSSSRRQRECVARCLPGYFFEGYDNQEEITLRCYNGEWTPSSSFPPCKSRGLCDLEMNGPGSFNCTSGMEGTYCDVQCRGYGARYFCYPGRNWEPSLPNCVRPKVVPAASNPCADPGFVANSRRMQGNGREAYREQDFEEGDSLVFSCNSGFALRGSSILVCQSSGWSDPLPQCQSIIVTERPIQCSDPGQVRFANRISQNGTPASSTQQFAVGASVIYNCGSNTVLEGSSVLRCLPSGEWSSPRPVCRPSVTTPITTTTEDIRNCRDPGRIRNGDRTALPFVNARINFFPPGTRFEFSCNEGYVLDGDKQIFCLITGVWTSRAPTCERTSLSSTNNDKALAYCPNPAPVPQAQKSIFWAINERNRRPSEEDPEYPVDTQIEYKCDEGYVLRGSETITCEETGEWSDDVPSCRVECGVSLIQTSRRITNGNKTMPGEWPWTVAIANLTRRGRYDVMCGGALIDQRTIVTAAHCLIPMDPKNFRIYLGKYYINERQDDDQVQTRTPTKFTIHPNYNMQTHDSDIAIVRFKPSIKYSERIQPICLPTRETSAKNLVKGQKGYVTGWGYTEKNLASNAMLKAHTPVITNDECQKSYRDLGSDLQITSNMFCAGEGKIGTCNGDSGGPLVFYNEERDSYSLEGVVSLGIKNQCGMDRRYNVYTKVIPFLQWILRSI